MDQEHASGGERSLGHSNVRGTDSFSASYWEDLKSPT